MGGFFSSEISAAFGRRPAVTSTSVSRPIFAPRVKHSKVYNRLNAVTPKHREDFENAEPRWPSKPPTKSAQEYVFVSPTGEVLKVKGLRGICEAYDLNPSHMSKVHRGIYVHHRGWTSELVPA